MSEFEPPLLSYFYSGSELIALGRIAELSAQLEVLLRTALAQALGFRRRPDVGDALFLGERATALVTRIKAIAKLSDAPRWLKDEGVDWAIRVGKAIDERDDLIHRAPTFHTEAKVGDRLFVWNLARRSHEIRPIDGVVLMRLVETLQVLEEEGLEKLGRHQWDESIGTNLHPEEESTE